MTDRVACVLPALDAAATLPLVAAGLRRAVPGATLVAVDDGSTDGTRAAAEACCDVVLAFPRNRGKGAALRAGTEAALARGAAAVLTVDTDGQHDPDYAPRLLAALEGADVVVGARSRRAGDMPLRRRVTNALSSAAVSRFAGCEVADAQSGYRAIRAEVLRAVRPAGDRYEYESQFLILAARHGFRIACVPVPTIYGAPSHFDELRDAARVVAAIWRLRRPGLT
ncbi:MAG: glycosyltransferase family 2 protein [Gemmatimonadaceae bacterium]